MSTPSTNQHPEHSGQPPHEPPPTCAAITDDEARLNARRLSLSARWRAALGEPSDQGDGSARGEEEEAQEAWSQIWLEAATDDAALSMLRQDEDEILGHESLDAAEMEHARARFRNRMGSALQASQSSKAALQVLEAPQEAAGLTVGDVVEVMERESSGQAPERGAASWGPILEPMRASREALPSHITANAMSAFWKKMGVSVPREVASAFNQAARLMLMGRATPGARLSLARPADSSGLSQAVARLAEQSEEAESHEASQQEPPNEDESSAQHPAST